MNELSGINHSRRAENCEINELRDAPFLTLAKFLMDAGATFALRLHLRETFLVYKFHYTSGCLNVITRVVFTLLRHKTRTGEVREGTYQLQDTRITLTLLRSVERVVFRHILDVVHQRRLWQNNLLLVDLVDGVLKG